MPIDFNPRSYEEGKKFPSKITCNVQNNYCLTVNKIKAQNLDNCPLFYPNVYFLINGKKIKLEVYEEKYFLFKDLKKEFLGAKIFYP